MKSLVTAIVQALVDKPDEVQIKEVVGDHAHVLELRVAKEAAAVGFGEDHAMPLYLEARFWAQRGDAARALRLAELGLPAGRLSVDANLAVLRDLPGFRVLTVPQ